MSSNDESMNDQTIDDQALDRRLAALPQHASVDSTIWPKIEHRLRPHSKRAWFGGAAAAACFLAVVTITNYNAPNWSELHRTMALQAEAEAMSASSLVPQMISQVSWPEDMRIAWNEYEVAIDELERALELNPGYQVLIDTLAAKRLQQSRLVNQAQSIGMIRNTHTEQRPTGVQHYDI